MTCAPPPSSTGILEPQAVQNAPTLPGDDSYLSTCDLPDTQRKVGGVPLRLGAQILDTYAPLGQVAHPRNHAFNARTYVKNLLNIVLYGVKPAGNGRLGSRAPAGEMRR
jgi:hypothetical protein